MRTLSQPLVMFAPLDWPPLEKLSIFSKFANVVSNQIDLITRSVDLSHIDLFLIDGCIGVEHLDASNRLVVCSQQREFVGLKPKCFRIHGKISAEHGYVHSVRSDVNSDCLPEIRKIANQAKSLEISILDDETDPSALLGAFPTNFTHVSVATLCKKSDIIVRFVDRIVDSEELRYLNLIGGLEGAIQSLDKTLLKLIELNRWEEIFVQMEGVIKEEIVFLERVIRWWKKFVPGRERELAVSFKAQLFEIDFIKNLRQGVVVDDKSKESRRYFYMSHPKDSAKEARFSKNESGMLCIKLT